MVLERSSEKNGGETLGKEMHDCPSTILCTIVTLQLVDLDHSVRSVYISGMNSRNFRGNCAN